MINALPVSNLANSPGFEEIGPAWSLAVYQSPVASHAGALTINGFAAGASSADVVPFNIRGFLR